MSLDVTGTDALASRVELKAVNVGEELVTLAPHYTLAPRGCSGGGFWGRDSGVTECGV